MRVGETVLTFLLRQYHLQRCDVIIEPGAGDHVIDGGACLGDTVTDFARTVGSRGHVYPSSCTGEAQPG